MTNAPDVLQAGAATFGPEEMSVITAAFDSNGRDVARLKASGLIALQDSPTAH